MPPLLKRIVVNGLLTATALAVIGFGMAELARMWLAAGAPQPGPGPARVPPDQSVAGTLQFRVPVTLAVAGFVFVAVGEVLITAWRNRRGSRPPSGHGRELKPDTAEVLLEELLRQLESRSPPGAPADAAAAVPPIPSLPTADNSPPPLNQRPA